MARINWCKCDYELFVIHSSTDYHLWGHWIFELYLIFFVLSFSVCKKTESAELGVNTHRPSVCRETQKRSQCWASTQENHWTINHFSKPFQQVKLQVGIGRTHRHNGPAHLDLPWTWQMETQAPVAWKWQSDGVLSAFAVLHSHSDAKRRINPSARPSTGSKGHKTIKVSQNNGSLPFISGKGSPLIDRRRSFQTFKAVPKVWGTTSVGSVSGLKTPPPPPPPTVWQLLWWFGRHSAAAWQLQYIT